MISNSVKHVLCSCLLSFHPDSSLKENDTLKKKFALTGPFDCWVFVTVRALHLVEKEVCIKFTVYNT